MRGGSPQRRREPAQARSRAERRLFAFDRALGVRLVAGADEAGRGCLAGPLVAAAVLFDTRRSATRELPRARALNDSKQHDAEAREELYPLVLRVRRARSRSSRAARAASTAAGCTRRTSPRCATRCRRRAARRLCLTDGFPVADFGYEQRAIVDGDATSAAIAAASIIAKVTRDRYMQPRRRAAPGLGVRRARRLLDARAPRGDPAPGRLAAAPACQLPDRRRTSSSALA